MDGREAEDDAAIAEQRVSLAEQRASELGAQLDAHAARADAVEQAHASLTAAFEAAVVRQVSDQTIVVLLLTLFRSAS